MGALSFIDIAQAIEVCSGMIGSLNGPGLASTGLHMFCVCRVVRAFPRMLPQWD